MPATAATPSTSKSGNSGNPADGVLLDGSSATLNALFGNYIGTDISGTVSLGNSKNGVEISGSANTIGGTTGAARNVISGNVMDGVLATGSTNTGMDGANDTHQ